MLLNALATSKTTMIATTKPKRERASLKTLWLEYSVIVTSPDGLTYSICGLCGNTGLLNQNICNRNFRLQVEAWCICPNGRCLRKQTKGSKYGAYAESIISTLPFK